MDQELREKFTNYFSQDFEEKHGDLLLALGSSMSGMSINEIKEMIRAFCLILAMRKQTLRDEAAAAWQ